MTLTLWTCIKLLSVNFQLNRFKNGMRASWEIMIASKICKALYIYSRINVFIIHTTPQPFTDISQYYTNDEITEKKKCIYIFTQIQHISNGCIWQISLRCAASTRHRELNSLSLFLCHSIYLTIRNRNANKYHILERWPSPLPPHENRFTFRVLLYGFCRVCFFSSSFTALLPRSTVMRSVIPTKQSFGI